MSSVQLLVALSAMVLLPASFLLILWRKRLDEPGRWLPAALYTGAYVAYLYVAGSWAFLSYYLRYLWPLVFLAVTAASYRRLRGRLRPRRSDLRRTWSDWLVAAVFATLLVASLPGYRYGDTPVELAFPLGEGRYYVGQGGNSPVVNYHNTHPSQKYALDIVALNAAGMRAAGLYPTDPGLYVIFGTPVYSPCDGTVTAAVDGLPDLKPPARDPEHIAGNHIIVRCGGVNVVLAHLQQGSVAVEVGDRVSVGRFLARVGNSGNTTEPHLHVHAVRSDTPDSIEGEAVPVLFDGRFPVRNSVFVGTAR